MPTRFAMIWLDAAADEPLAELGGRTPLEAAATPHCDAICALGRQGTVRTIPPETLPQPDVALVSLAGYHPRSYTGLGALEAVGQKVRLAADEIAFRCNLVTVGGGILLDATAGGIRSAEAAGLMDELTRHLADRGARFHAGEAFRHVMTLNDAAGLRIAAAPAYEVERKPIAAHLPTGRGANRVREILREAETLLARSDVNLVRRDLSENPANAVWLWGGGRVPRWKRFRARFGARAAVVGDAAMTRGLASLLGWTVAEPAAAGDDLHSDCAEQGRAAVATLDEFDLVVVHAAAPCEATLCGRIEEKVRAIETIDREIVGPVLERIQRFERFRILVAATLAGRVARRRFSPEPAPYCLAGALVDPSGRGVPFSERTAIEAGQRVEVGSDLMEYFLRV